MNHALEAGWRRVLVARDHGRSAHAVLEVVVMAGDFAGASSGQEVSDSNDARDSELPSIDALPARLAGGP